MLKFTGFFISLMSCFGAHAADITSLDCTGHSTIIHLELSGPSRDLFGRLTHNYNGAALACEQGAIEKIKNGSSVNCVGPWDTAFDSAGNNVVANVTVTVFRDGKGAIIASFENSWDQRAPVQSPSVATTCTLN